LKSKYGPTGDSARNGNTLFPVPVPRPSSAADSQNRRFASGHGFSRAVTEVGNFEFSHRL